MTQPPRKRSSVAQGRDRGQSSAIAKVEQLYRTLLGREIDVFALTDKAARFAAGTTGFEEIVEEIVSSDEFRARVSGGGGQRFTNDHSQFGEIWLLLREMVNEAATGRWVVDVGARGRDRSNSYDLMREFGWRGLLVEANPALLSPIQEEFAGLDIRLIGAAVSDYVGRARLTIGANDDVSSLSPDAAGSWGETRGSVEVDVVRLPDLLRAHDVPTRFDLLSLDIEGEDVKVLNDLIGTSAFRPRWIIVEASDDFRARSLADAGASAAVQAGYGIVAQTAANLLLRHVGPPATREEIVRELDAAVAPVHAIATAVLRNQGHAPDIDVHGDAPAADRIRAIGRLLAPRAAVGVAKVRVGGEADGGYVMLDDLGEVRDAFSLGVGDEVSWDLAMAERGIRVHQFDPTVAGPPVAHANFAFHPRRIVPRATDGPVTLASLHATARAARADGTPAQLLKIDIEGDEWEVLLAAAPEDLAGYRQLLCEFHGFDATPTKRWSDRAMAVLERLDRQFQCVHIHANNCAPLVAIGGVPFPCVLEATFAHRGVYRFEAETALFPTSLDRPNNAALPDHYLGRFAF